MKSVAPPWHHGLVLALVLALMLLFVSYLRTIGDSQSMVFHDRVLESLYAGSIWGTTLGDNLVKFTLAVLFVYAMYGLACWAMALLSARAWPAAQVTRRQHVLLWFILFTFGVLANNAASFNTSALGQPYAEAMMPPLFGVPTGRWILIVVCAAAFITALVAVIRHWRKNPRLSRGSLLGLGALGLVGLGLSAHSMLPPEVATPEARPNVILIGLDSLRDDLLDPELSPQVTPHLAAFMTQGTRFSNAMTPLARTFPSMCSMFTGRHPHTTGAVMNLLPRHLIDDSESLPRVLTRAGYHAVYATDEVRFANIDTSYGFAQTITPPIGASEFLIEKIADSPVVNLVVNTRLGGWLFPHVHANRGAAKTYDPDTFVRRVDRELRPEQPLFLVTHLTLDHWPYLWAGAPIRKKDDQARWPPYYLHAAQRVDQQFADIMRVLQGKGLLKNSIVVVYSDHGESFDAPYDALVPEQDPLIHTLGIKPPWGHGTSVLSPHQFRIILGMRRFGDPWQEGRVVRSPVSFEDIAPTLVDALRIPTSARFDGRSMLGLIENQDGAAQAFDGRIRFTETEYQMPAGLATQEGSLSPSKVRDALAVYSVDRHSDRITVKESRLGKLLLQRQYAALGEHFMVAAFPSRTEPGFNYLAVSLTGGTPRQMLAPPTADEPELQKLWLALHARFAGTLTGNPLPVADPTVANPQRTIPSGVTK